MPYYKGRVGDVNIFRIIEAYTRGSRYDPFAQKTIDALNAYALAAGSSANSEDADKAAEDFRALLEWHLPNHTILRSALPLVRENPARGHRFSRVDVQAD